ncbi:hypothetical protein ONZ45_g14102 [Pleurotus djamor]|nr:hypothetical protein ONZ45_g14102 [Pleurotus djamor]
MTDILSLPTDEIVRRALQKLSEHANLILWGSLLDNRMNVPRIQKNFTFLVPDEKLDTLSAVLTEMNLPIPTLPNYLLRAGGDFLRLGRLHRVTQATDRLSMQCIHLLPASLLGYAEDELETALIEGTPITIYVPRPSAVYAAILRMMPTYRRWCAEQSKLQSDLLMLIYYDLLGLEKVPAGHEPIEDAVMEKRSEVAVERVRGWGRAGEWREGEEWMEDVIVGFVMGEMDMGDLPCLESVAADAMHKTLARMDDNSETVIGDI